MEIPLSAMKNNKLKVLTILFHEVVDNPTDSGFQRKSALPFKHGIHEFKKNIDIIFKNSEVITTVDRLEASNKSNLTLLAFDDGGKSNLLSADYLDTQQLKGHFFIATSLIGDPYFMTEDEILRLDRQGHIIGSHSHTHPNVFKSLSYNEMMEEWSKSKSILEKLLKHPVDYCSIPGGDANPDAYQSAVACGYKYIFDSEPILKLRSLEGAFIFGRVCPKRGTSYAEIENLSKFKGIKRRRIIRKFKNTTKSIFFPIYKKIRNNSKHKSILN